MRPQCLPVVLLALMMTVACGSEPQSGSTEPEPEPVSAPAEPEAWPSPIVAERGGFIPEGVEYDMTNDRLLTGSLSEGSIYEISRDGAVTALVTDADLVSSVGIEADEPRDRLLVANSDRSVFDGSGAGQAKLGVYALATGERMAMVDLAAAVPDAPSDAAYFANDVAVDDGGTIYVTDTRMQVIYRVGDDYEASVLHRFDTFAPNGIVHHPSGYLLVAGGTELWKVPVDDPSAATAVALPEEIPGQDGAVWTSSGELALVSNSSNRVVALTSDDDWATAQVARTASYDTQATTAAVVGDDVFVVHPHFADEEPPSFERVTFR